MADSLDYRNLNYMPFYMGDPTLNPTDLRPGEIIWVKDLSNTIRTAVFHSYAVRPPDPTVLLGGAVMVHLQQDKSDSLSIWHIWRRKDDEDNHDRL